MIGHRLYLLRKAAGLSQAELGDMLSVSHHTICSYEKDKSDPSDATKEHIYCTKCGAVLESRTVEHTPWTTWWDCRMNRIPERLLRPVICSPYRRA